MGVPIVGIRKLAKQWKMEKGATRGLLDEAFAINKSRNAVQKAIHTAESGAGHASQVASHQPYSAFDPAGTYRVHNGNAPPTSYTPSVQKVNTFRNDSQYGDYRKSFLETGRAPANQSAFPNASSGGSSGPSFVKDISVPRAADNTASDRLFSQNTGGPLRQGVSTALNGAFGGYNGQLGTKIMAMSAGAGVTGGIIGGVGAALFPNNIEYQGTVAPIIKGAVAGVAIGMAHGASSAMMKKYKPGEFMHKFANKTQSITSNWKTGGLIAGAVAMGTTNTNFTNPINRVQGV